MELSETIPDYWAKNYRSFITDIASDRQDQAIVKAIIELANGLEIPTVAEGVETWGQLLHHLGCKAIQGYLLTESLPYSQVIHWSIPQMSLR
ncbi:MAG TPA: EAL domain-containing protein [Thermosynechococcus sp. M98_K2018_005]|nr:EAL domain-containing protein [Thermosynechococcus sp. M98_K2018_005]HIK48064.1 EAL domain-containing protein [Thermosynechococcus sp. M55_K2018_012]